MGKEIRTSLEARRALRILGRAIFEQNNFIGTDFEDVGAQDVECQFQQDSQGVVIQFTISRQALGKIVDTDERADALEELLKHPIPQTVHDE